MSERVCAKASSQPLPPPDKPLDGGGTGASEINKVVAEVTFREKVLGGKAPIKPSMRRDLLAENLAQVEFIGGNRYTHMIHLKDEVVEELSEPWKDALIIKLLGKSVGYRVMRDRLQSLWKMQAGFDMQDLGNGFYIVKFDMMEDQLKVMDGGPWMLFDHYLTVCTWSPDFIADMAKIKQTLVWIRFPSLNMMFFDESVLVTMASMVGKPIKVDTNTMRTERGKFAWVYVEIDLT